MAATKVIIVAFFVTGVITGIIWKLGPRMWPSPTLPPIPEGWWAKEDKSSFKENPAIRKFKISVPDEVLTDLKSRLKNSRVLAEPVKDAAFHYGFNTKYLEEVKSYWLEKYDWRKEEVRLNQYDGFKTQIEGIDIHFLHVKPKNVPNDIKILPLLMIHGWPGSVAEFYKIIPLLTTPRKENKFVFEVICPHIPGYGFSEAPHRPGFGQLDAAQVFHKLMKRLGHDKYYVQGGDWGSIITQHVAVRFPESVLGIHVTMVAPSTTGQWIKLMIGNWIPSLVVDNKDYHKIFPLGQKSLFMLQEMGYMHLQATKPDTIGVGLNDSPIGLAAYILEKFSTWTSAQNIPKDDGGLLKKFTMDELLTNVMLYWVTGSITSSMRFYKEWALDYKTSAIAESIAIEVPAGIAAFPNELLNLPRNLAEHRFFNLLRYTDMPRGGHFGSMEEPELTAADVWAFVELADQQWKNKTMAS